MSNRLVLDLNQVGKKWVVYFDLLGFSNLVKESDFVHVFYEWEKVWNAFRINLKDHPKLEYAHFSDTFLIYAPDNSINSFRHIDQCSRWFFQHAIMHQIPLRGAMACGEFYADKPNGIFLGKALVLAYEFGEQFNWIGFSLSPSAIERMQTSEVGMPSCPINYRQWDVPTSKSKMPQKKTVTALLCGCGNGRDYIITLEGMKQRSLENMERKQKTVEQMKKVAEKYDNTIQFIKRFEDKDDGSVNFG